MGICKTSVRVAAVGGLLTGAAVLIAGPHRVMAVAGLARDKVVDGIDAAVGDPIALRSQIKELEEQYPKRIADVRAELGEVRAQIETLSRDKAVAEKVVSMAQNDLSDMKDLLGKAESARTDAPAAVINVRFNNQPLTLDQAYGRATQINNTLTAYASRVADADRDLGFLQQQATRLEELLNTLETERAQFQAQVWQLSGQIEMIARNDKLIDLVEKRTASMDRFNKYEAVSLDNVTGRINKIRAEQESRLQALANHTKGDDYETKARTMINAESAARAVFEKTQLQANPSAPAIEVGPTGTKQTKPASPGSPGSPGTPGTPVASAVTKTIVVN